MFLNKIAPTIRHSVAFLVQERTDETTGSEALVPLATAFFVHIKITDRTFAGYLVTARHNLEYACKEKDLYVRANLLNGTYTDVLVPHLDQWIQHPITDVALIPFKPPDNGSFMSISSDWIIKNEALQTISPHGPQEGSEVCFVSLFALAPGSKRIQPLIRFGRISLMPHEPVLVKIGPQNKREIDCYLVECLSWGGCSGAPVLVDYPDFSRTASNMSEIINCAPVGLLGLISSHFDMEQLVQLNDADGIKVPNNSGIAAVIPAQAIWDLLLRDDLVKQRELAAKALLSV